MSLSLQADPLPLRVDEHGSIRIGNTRVLLELVIRAYQAGLNAEQIAERFDTLELADIHAVVAYYLRHRSEIEEYMRRRQSEAEEVRQQIEAELPRRLTREELLARRSARQEP
ncbi:MAG TPA: DUF433 domain-containing protein [Gemmataceae bacterium]|nr:DUF433 domain-containing protein [Gemmataceae bacterium]